VRYQQQQEPQAPMPKSATDKRHFILAAALVAISTLLMDMLLKRVLPLPVQASLEALTIDALIGWHLTLIAFLFSLIVVLMLYSIVVFRRRPGDDSDGVHFEGNTALEIIWTVIPLILVLVFSFYGVNALAAVTRAESNELTVKVNGFQWSWSFEYTTPDGQTFVSPELVLPNNQRVHMEMTSRDVIHSFWIPEMRVKQDLVPGHTTDVRFTPRLTGDYKLTCAEMCGLTHWNMVAAVRVVEPAEYEAWFAEQTAALTPTVAQSNSN
jgi:cytochrome c oxidase subunit 2